jgi:hypothetical protein
MDQDLQREIQGIAKEQQGQSLVLLEILAELKVQTSLLRVIAADVAPETRVVGKLILGKPVKQ